MRSRIVKVVKYFFDNGNLTVDQIKCYVVVGTLTVEDFKAITGEDYVAEHLEANDNENENEESSSEPSNETEAKEANDSENEESSSQPAQ